MSSNLDKSLDESNKRASTSHRGGRSRDYSGLFSGKAPDTRWDQDKFDGNQPDRSHDVRFSPGSLGGSPNLSRNGYDPNARPKELFPEVGELKSCSVDYDKSGQSKGTAEVVYSRRKDALEARRRYNNVNVEGKPMKIGIVSSTGLDHEGASWSGSGPTGPSVNHDTDRPASCAPQKAPALFTTSSAVETETKLYISSLDHNISMADIEGHDCI